ncbi:MAG: cobalamin biosynthesis protein [Gammaproteobacteria bacterium]|nr:cobalamin biosynthesis protein [Gammaproteobacteria bacterium]MCF6364542.1 cobalamin biosynthesis protein [Gammaproteobacteria bacterium]
MKVILGMGCDRGTSQQTLETTVDLALQEAGLARDAIHALATIDKKNDEAALLAFSAEHGWPLNFYSAAQLSTVEVPNPSEVVRKYMGTPAVAEAAAMLAANTGIENLLLEKIKYRGVDNKNATVSIVRLHNDQG